MKNLKIYKMAAIMALLVIFCSSCGEDDPVLPDYVGTWVTTATLPTELGDFSGKQTLTLTEKSFSDLAQIQLGTQWTDVLLMKGSISVNGNRITQTVKELGVTSFNLVTSLPTGVIVTSKEGDEDFNSMMEEFELEETITSEFSISGNKLTLKSDDNKDGDYDDDLEIIVYTKQ